MTDRPNDALLIAGKFLTILMQGVMIIAGFALLVAAAAVVFARGSINAEIASEFSGAVGDLPLIPALSTAAMALIVVALVYAFFDRLRAIITSVGERDPFEPENAERLSAMAWLLLAVQVVSIPLAGVALVLAEWAEPMEDGEISIDAGLDLTGILLVIILFILARVFKHGAAMRADLEGTV